MLSEFEIFKFFVSDHLKGDINTHVAIQNMQLTFSQTHSDPPSPGMSLTGDVMAMNILYSGPGFKKSDKCRHFSHIIILFSVTKDHLPLIV